MQGEIAWDQMHIKTQLNTLMDEHVATYFRKERKNMPHQKIAESLPAQLIQFTLPYDTPTSNIIQRLQAFKIGHAAEREIMRKFNITQRCMEKINWQALLRAVKPLSASRKHSLSKGVYENWCVMEVAKKFKLADTNMCPLCK